MASQWLTAFISQRLNYMKCHWCLHHIQNHFHSFVAIIFHLSLWDLISIQYVYTDCIHWNIALTAPFEESTLHTPNVSRSPSAPKQRHIEWLHLRLDFTNSKGTDSAFLGWLVCIQFFQNSHSCLKGNFLTAPSFYAKAGWCAVSKILCAAQDYQKYILYIYTHPQNAYTRACTHFCAPLCPSTLILLVSVDLSSSPF